MFLQSQENTPEKRCSSYNFKLVSHNWTSIVCHEFCFKIPSVSYDSKGPAASASASASVGAGWMCKISRFHFRLTESTWILRISGDPCAHKNLSSIGPGPGCSRMLPSMGGIFRIQMVFNIYCFITSSKVTFCWNLNYVLTCFIFLLVKNVNLSINLNFCNCILTFSCL